MRIHKLIFRKISHMWWAFLIAQLIENWPVMQETLVQFLGREDLLEKGKVTHASLLGLPYGSAGKESACHVGDLGWEDPLEKGTATHSSILAWRIPWTV